MIEFKFFTIETLYESNVMTLKKKYLKSNRSDFIVLKSNFLTLSMINKIDTHE